MPIGAAAAVFSYLLIDESRDRSREQRPDVPGLVAARSRPFRTHLRTHRGQQPRLDVGAHRRRFSIAAVSLAAFVLLEQRQRLPMLDLSLFRSGTFTGANIVVLLVTLAMFGIFFFLSLYMQNVLGYSAVQAGAAFLPMTLLVVRRAAGRTPPRTGSGPAP